MKREKWRYFRVNEENNSVENVENDPVPDDGNQVQGDQCVRTSYKTRNGRSAKPNGKYTEKFV